MKVIELLNKIANGEEVPKKIKYLIYEYTYDDNDEEYKRNKNGEIFALGEDIRLDIVLCDEVEIIEENKKIEKLFAGVRFDDNGNRINEVYSLNKLANKINEIIDILNEMREDK